MPELKLLYPLTRSEAGILCELCPVWARRWEHLAVFRWFIDGEESAPVYTCRNCLARSLQRAA